MDLNPALVTVIPCMCNSKSIPHSTAAVPACKTYSNTATGQARSGTAPRPSLKEHSSAADRPGQRAGPIGSRCRPETVANATPGVISSRMFYIPLIFLSKTMCLSIQINIYMNILNPFLLISFSSYFFLSLLFL